MKPEQIASIQKGKTTEADLIKMFGEPKMRTSDSEGNHQLTFMHAEQHNALAGEFYGGAYNMQSQSLTVTIGPDGTVKDFRTSDSKTGGPINWGG
jgi:hypothetical protein